MPPVALGWRASFSKLARLAGWRAQSSKVETFGTALEALERQPGGDLMLALTAIGLIFFGAYAFVEARFRRIRVPKDLGAG